MAPHFHTVRALVTVLLVVATFAPAAHGADLDGALARARAATHAPAAMGAVVRDGRVVWAGASGRGATTRSLTILASTTKLVTAALTLQLVDAGRLSLDDPVARWYPRLRGVRGVTVRMLLGHTSGLAEYFGAAALSAAFDDPRHRWTRAEVLAAIGPSRFAPGTRFAYTNTNYVVLGGILERVSGLPVQRLLERGVTQPLGITDATFDRVAALVPRFARSPSWVAGFGPPTDAWGPVWTDGGIAATATDLARIGDAVLGGRLLSPASVIAMTTMGKGDYGLGAYAQELDGHGWLGHDGSYDGWESEVWRDPARRLTIAVTTNRDEPDDADDTISDRIWRALVRAEDS